MKPSHFSCSTQHPLQKLRDTSDTEKPNKSRDDIDVFAERVVREKLRQLKRRGMVLEKSGCLPPLCVHIHTDYGPLDQEKERNQDYVMVLSGESKKGLPFLAIAMADGLTCSYRSDVGARLACYCGLHSLAVDWNGRISKVSFQKAVTAGCSVLKKIRNKLSKRYLDNCPPGFYPATWDYILSKGKLLQTTLSLILVKDGWLRAGIVGDGGFCWRSYNPKISKSGGDCNPDVFETNAIGPSVDQRLIQLDHYVQKRISRPFLAAFYTDGVGRGLGNNALSLLDDLEGKKGGESTNMAQAYLERAIQKAPALFNDNLTLAVVRL